MFKFDFSKRLESFNSFFKQLLIAHWRSLLMLLVGVYLPFQVFEALAVDVWKNQAGFPWDVPILLAIHQSSQPQLDVFAVTLTQFGEFWSVFSIVTVIGLVLLFRRRWRSLVYLLTAVVGSTMINRTAKVLMHRVRPHLWDSISPEYDYAFPSGHSMTSMALVAALVILTWGTSWRWLVLSVGSLFVLGIGWTRLYLGVHFPSDILGGWMATLAWAIGLSVIIRPHLTKAPAVNDDEPLDKTSLRPQEVRE